VPERRFWITSDLFPAAIVVLFFPPLLNPPSSRFCVLRAFSFSTHCSSLQAPVKAVSLGPSPSSPFASQLGAFPGPFSFSPSWFCGGDVPDLLSEISFLTDFTLLICGFPFFLAVFLKARLFRYNRCESALCFVFFPFPHSLTIHAGGSTRRFPRFLASLRSPSPGRFHWDICGVCHPPLFSLPPSLCTFLSGSVSPPPVCCVFCAAIRFYCLFTCGASSAKNRDPPWPILSFFRSRTVLKFRLVLNFLPVFTASQTQNLQQITPSSRQRM